jgi:hypothetical protein
MGSAYGTHGIEHNYIQKLGGEKQTCRNRPLSRSKQRWENMKTALDSLDGRV